MPSEQNQTSGVGAPATATAATSMSLASMSLPLPVSGAPTTWSSTDEVGSTLYGTGDNDQLSGSAKDITLIGGAGDDTYFVYDHTNIVVEEADGGIDTIATYGVH